MSDLPSWLAPDLSAHLTTLGLRVLMLGIAGTSGLVIFLLLWRRAAAPDLGRLLTEIEAQLALVDRQLSARRRWTSRLNATARRRLAGAGFARVGPGHLVGISLACGIAGLAVAGVLLPAGPFMALGLLLGLTLPWTWLGGRGRRRRQVVERQVAEMLSVMTGAAGTGATPQQALLEVLAQNVAEPLAGHLRRATRDLDPRHGLTDRSFLQMMGHLDDDLASPSFHLAAQAIDASTRLGVDLRESLERSAGAARDRIAYQAEVRADFAYMRAAASLVFSLPVALTLVLHWLLPGTVEAAYSGPVGWAMAAALAAWCVLGYRIVTVGERRSVARLDVGAGA